MFSLWMRSRPAIPQDPLAITCIRDGRPRGGGKERYLHTWGENLRFYHGVLPLLQAFEQVGIDAVVLKGLALIARFYRDPGLRPMADVDVLVSSTDVERVSAIAGGLGWRSRHRLTPGFLRVKHAGPFDHQAGVACDIHWRCSKRLAAAGSTRGFEPPPSW